MTETVYWTGVGSRRSSPENHPVMTAFAQAMSAKGAILRSGAAPGPDTWFEEGAPPHLRHIYVPNASFGKRKRSEIIVPKEVNLTRWLRACSIAESLHPLGRHMSQEVRDLMGRNVFQVLGDDLKTPSKFLVCDAPDIVYDDQGRVVDVDGGTGMAVRIAALHNVPVYHLAVPAHRAKIDGFIAQHQAWMARQTARPTAPRP